MRTVVGKAGRDEIGGILMAEQMRPGTFRVVDFSVDPQTGSTAHFVRSVEQHEAELSKFYKRTGDDYARFNYLGEWHSHPNHPPRPSAEDVLSMQSLVHGERAIPFAVLMIVRISWWRLAGSATLCQRHERPQQVEMIRSTPEVRLV